MVVVENGAAPIEESQSLHLRKLRERVGEKLPRCGEERTAGEDRMCLHRQSYRLGHATVFASLMPHQVAPFPYGAARVSINMFGVMCDGVRWWVSG